MTLLEAAVAVRLVGAAGALVPAVAVFEYPELPALLNARTRYTYVVPDDNPELL